MLVLVLVACESPTASDTGKAPYLDSPGDSPVGVDTQDSAVDAPVDSPTDSPADTAETGEDSPTETAIDSEDTSDTDTDGYLGGWPTNPDKDLLDEPDPGDDCSIGTRIPRVELVDQYGELVDLYDFADHGLPVVIHMAATWNYYDQEMSTMLSGAPSFYDSYGWGDVEVPVNDGKVYWITILQLNLSGDPATAADSASWAGAYPNALIPVLADEDLAFGLQCPLVGFPTLIQMDEGLIIERRDPSDYSGIMDWILTL